MSNESLGKAGAIHLSVEEHSGRPHIVGAYYVNDTIVDHANAADQKFWLVQGLWPFTAECREEVEALAVKEVESLGGSAKLLLSSEIWSYSETVPPAAMLDAERPAGVVSLSDYAAFLRGRWEKFIPDRREVDRRILQFWTKVIASIEQGEFDAVGDHIIDGRGASITSVRLALIQRHAEGVFDTPALARYVAEGMVPLDAIRRWADRINEEIPPAWIDEVSADEEDTVKTAWVREATETVGPKEKTGFSNIIWRICKSG